MENITQLISTKLVPLYNYRALGTFGDQYLMIT